MSDIPIFDADNHFYETTEAFTKFLPDPYKGVIEYIDVHGQTKIAVKGLISNYIPNPTFDKVARPGAQEEYYRIGNPEGKSRREMFGKAIDSPPSFREPASRLKLMDEQGIDRTLMFPTLASLIEERLRDDPDTIHVIIHALNEWMYETWGFNHEDRIFSTPVISPCIVEKGLEELEWCLERGAKTVLIRPAPVPGLRGPRSFALPEFDPLWARIVEADIPVMMHSSDSGYARYVAEWTGEGTEMLPFVPQTFRMLQSWRGIEDSVSSLVCHGALTRFPDLRVAIVENGMSWVEPLLKAMKDLYKKMPKDFFENPIEAVRRCIYISPFWEDDLAKLAELIGEDHVLFGSDYPHPEGLANPAGYTDELREKGLSEELIRKLMGENTARLMRLPVTV